MTLIHSTRPSDPKEGEEWDRGYAYGFAGNRIPHWYGSGHSRLFLLGYDAGAAELEELVEWAVWENENYGWWL
jgi:hypothetical protein